HVDLHVVEMELAAPLGRAAIVADIMVERALPAILKLAARNEDHVGVLEPRHIAAEVAAIPRVLHAVNDREDRGCVRLRARCSQSEEGDEAHSWNCPTITVWQWPPRITRLSA